MTLARPLSALCIVLLLVAGCGVGDEAEPVTGASRPSQEGAPDAPAEGTGDGLPFGLRRCPAEPDRVSAHPDRYRSEPVYVGNEMPSEEVRAWAATKPGFEELWIDRENFGWLTVAFSQDAERRQAELAERFPDVGVVAVEVPWTGAELIRLRDDAFAALAAHGIAAGGGHSVSTGLVSVWVGELSEDRLEPLAPLAGPRLCVEGVDPEDVIRPGPQPEAGDGWRLVGSGRTGPTYRTGVATDAAQYQRLWAQTGLPGRAPAVDFEDEIVVWFGAVYGSGCEIRMDDVVIDTERRLVHGRFVVPGSPQSCPDDANPRSYVVAVDRERLPVGPFAVQLDAEDPPAGAPDERTLVDADLRIPGSTAGDDRIGADPSLADPHGRPYVVTAGAIIEPGSPATYRVHLDCSFEVLGPFNGITWQAIQADLDERPPPAWTNAADADGTVEAELVLHADPARLVLTANGHAQVYGPARSAMTDCE